MKQESLIPLIFGGVTSNRKDGVVFTWKEVDGI